MLFARESPTTDAAERWGPRIALGGPGPRTFNVLFSAAAFANLIQIKSNSQCRLEPRVPLAGPREDDGKYAPCRILRQHHDRNRIRDVCRGYDAGSAVELSGMLQRNHAPKIVDSVS
jgi:hypothetical protein